MSLAQHIERTKWILDGVKTLTEAAARLREEADRLQKLHDDGAEVERADDGYLFYTRPGHVALDEDGMECSVCDSEA